MCKCSGTIDQGRENGQPTRCVVRDPSGRRVLVGRCCQWGRRGKTDPLNDWQKVVCMGDGEGVTGGDRSISQARLPVSQ